MTGASGPGRSTPHSSRGAAFGDFDNDGDVDVLVMNMNEPPSLLRNEYAGGNRWIEVKLEGTASNRAALGATVRVTAGGRTQAQAVLSQSSYYSHDDLRLHFGLGIGSHAEHDRSAVAERPGRRAEGRRGRTRRDDQGRGGGFETLILYAVIAYSRKRTRVYSKPPSHRDTELTTRRASAGRCRPTSRSRRAR